MEECLACGLQAACERLNRAQMSSSRAASQVVNGPREFAESVWEAETPPRTVGFESRPVGGASGCRRSTCCERRFASFTTTTLTRSTFAAASCALGPRIDWQESPPNHERSVDPRAPVRLLAHGHWARNLGLGFGQELVTTGRLWMQLAHSQLCDQHFL